MADNVASGAVKYLSAQSQVLGLVGTFPPGDPAAGQPYIFLNDLLVTLEGSSAAAIVLSPAGLAGAPPQQGSQRFQRLLVEVFIDPQRDGGRNITESSGRTIARGEDVFSAVHARLQRKDSDVQQWGDLLTASCSLLTEGEFTTWSDGDGLQRKQSAYGLLVTGWTDLVP